MIAEKENEILELIKASQTIEAGYRMLLQEFQEQLYWQIRKLVLDHDDAHDVLQNVFVKVFKGIKNFKGDSKLSSWLYRIAYNESMTFLTKKGKQLQKQSEKKNKYRTKPSFCSGEKKCLVSVDLSLFQ